MRFLSLTSVKAPQISAILIKYGKHTFLNCIFQARQESVTKKTLKCCSKCSYLSTQHVLAFMLYSCRGSIKCPFYLRINFIIYSAMVRGFLRFYMCTAFTLIMGDLLYHEHSPACHENLKFLPRS